MGFVLLRALGSGSVLVRKFVVTVSAGVVYLHVGEVVTKGISVTVIGDT